VGPPQQYSVQPAGSGTFYPGPGPGEYPAPYRESTIRLTPSHLQPGIFTKTFPESWNTYLLIWVPLSSQIRIRDPNQGGRDITEEIMAGVSGSRNSTPPVGPPSSTPTPPQVTLTCCKARVIPKSSSPGLVHLEAPLERLQASAPASKPSPPNEPELPPAPHQPAPVTLPLSAVNSVEGPSESTAPASSPSSSPGSNKTSLTPPQTLSTEPPLADHPPAAAAPQTPGPAALNGLADSGNELDAAPPKAAVLLPPGLQPQSPAYREAPPSESLPPDVRPEVPIAAPLSPLAPVAVVPVTLTPSPIPVLPATLPPGLPPLVQAPAEADELSETVDAKNAIGGEVEPGSSSGSKTEPQTFTRKSPPTGNVQLTGFISLLTTSTPSLPRLVVLTEARSISIPCFPSLFPEMSSSDMAESGGKRQYNREFLLNFQFMPACTQKPEGLPPISDVVLDKLMNMGTRRPPPRKIIMNVTVNDDVQLKKAENAWKPGMKRETLPEDPEAQRTQELFRRVRSILNKLTPQKFNQLMKQVTDLTIDTEERLKGVIDLVFEKAIDEPGFSVAYGNMCRCLATLKVQMTDKPNSTVNFRKLLLNRCQKEFEKDKVDDVVFERKQKELDSAASTTERERLQEELEEAKDKARRRSIGNIKFIGELFKLKMLTEAIMHDCVVKLLKNHDEESLECLCRLLTTIGKDLDFEKAKPRMDQYFNQMEKIVKERKTSSRIRFMLQDVIDLRLHNWVSRRADQGPKTIEQIHKEAKIEEQEEQRKVHQQLLSKDSKRRPDPREQRAQRDDTWNTVPTTKNSRTIDPNKIPKISKVRRGPAAVTRTLTPGELWEGTFSAVVWCLLPPSGPAHALLPSAAEALRSETSPWSPAHRRCGPARSTEGAVRKNCWSHRPPRGRKESGKGRSLGGRASQRTKASRSAAESEKRVRTPEQMILVPRHPAVGFECKGHARHVSPVKPEPPVPTVEKPSLSVEEIERKSKSIIEEFLHINDYKEAVLCVDELDLGSQLHIFVQVGVDSTLERSQITRDHMAEPFHTKFTDTLEMADDMAIDIPHIWLYLAEMLCPVLKDGGFSMRELFSELSKPLLPVGRAGILISEILHILCKQMSHRTVSSLWRESGISWTDVLPQGEDVQAFISQQKLEFLQTDGSGCEAAPSKRMLSPEELSQQLEKLLLEDMASDEQIFDWVEENLDEPQTSSPPFLRSLMTAVCKAAVKDENNCCRVDTAIIQRRLPVLLKYLNSDTERQLQALYALQALIVSLEQPANLLRMFFDCLYDEDVISEDAFYKWESSKDPAEQEGKGVALKSVTAFFTWLREAEEESEDN
uniref:Eukaryotic translation initiation factor 4 gamma, 3a n=1 Tax=Oryzias sinensis TaxID=183150 RepID=A0A8C7Y5U6_9TELE